MGSRCIGKGSKKTFKILYGKVRKFSPGISCKCILTDFHDHQEFFFFRETGKVICVYQKADFNLYSGL